MANFRFTIICILALFSIGCGVHARTNTPALNGKDFPFVVSLPPEAFPPPEATCNIYREVMFVFSRDVKLCEDKKTLSLFVIVYNGSAEKGQEIAHAWGIRVLPQYSGFSRYDFKSTIVVGIRRSNGMYCIGQRGKIPKPDIYTNGKGEDEGIELSLGEVCKERYKDPWPSNGKRRDESLRPVPLDKELDAIFFA